MKKIKLLFLSLVICLGVYSQVSYNHRWSVVGEIGCNYFDGDVSQKITSIFPGSIRQITLGASVEYTLTPILGLSLDMYYFPLKGENNYVSFQTRLYESDLNATINFTKAFFPHSNSKFSFNGSIGIGGSHYTFNPIIKNPSVTKFAIPDYGNSLSIPITFYLEYELSKHFNIGAKIHYRSNNKDNLEGIQLLFPNGKYYSSGGYDSNTNDAIGAGTIYLRYKFKSKKVKIDIDEPKLPYKDTTKCCGDTYIINNYYNNTININKGDSVKNDNSFIDNVPSVYFDFDKYYLDNNAQLIIRKVASIMKSNPNLYVEIRGYCDYMGNVPYNEKLSVNRTISVKNELVNKWKLSEEKIVTNGLGKLNEPSIKYRPNRRCDFFFFKIK